MCLKLTLLYTSSDKHEKLTEHKFIYFVFQLDCSVKSICFLNSVLGQVRAFLTVLNLHNLI